MNAEKKRRKDKVSVGGRGKYRTRDMIADRPKAEPDPIDQQGEDESETCNSPNQMEG